MTRTAYRVIGISVALTGVAIARLLAPALPPHFQTLTTALGVTVAIAGVLATALGAGRR